MSVKGKKRTDRKFTPEEVAIVIDEYMAECELSGSAPTLAGLRLKLGVTQQTIDRWCDESAEYQREFTRARDLREAAIVRLGLTNPKAAQMLILLLKQPANGGYIDKPQGDNERKITINIGGLGVENAGK